jgi:Protein of unknown function (DUF1566)/Repeat of unknown function (DUF5648)
MIHFSKKTVPSILFATLLIACSGQSNTDSATSVKAQQATQTQTTQTTQTARPVQSDLLASLAIVYPNGQLPTSKTAQAAKELAQNPAALHLTAQPGAETSINSQSTANPVQSMAVAADYKAVTRIQNTTLTGAYFFTIYDTEQSAALASNPNWKLEGPAFWASLASGTGLNPVHRFRNNINGSYLYTIYEAEKADIQANYAATFFYEGVAWYASQTKNTAGLSPLYRFRNLTNGTYLFSAYESEKNAIVANYSAIFQLEGVAYYVRQDAIPPNNDFSFIPNSSGDYYDKTECVKDAVTGLIWEGKPLDGFRKWNNVYTNYDSIAEQQIKVGASPAVAPTQAQIDAVTNSIGYKNAVNASNLCGASNWRLPTKAELLTIVRPKSTDYPYTAIDNYWFPNTDPWVYVTSTPVINFAWQVWGIYFNYGDARDTDDRTGCCIVGEGYQHVRLVRNW